VVETCLQKDFNRLFRIFERVLQCLNQDVYALGNFRVFDGLSNQIQCLRSLFSDSGMGVAETAGETGDDDG